MMASGQQAGFAKGVKSLEDMRSPVILSAHRSVQHATATGRHASTGLNDHDQTRQAI